MPVEVFANDPATLVISGGTNAPAAGTQQTWTVVSSATFPPAVTGSTQFHVADVVAPSEVILVTNVSGTTWTVTRGAEGSTPVPHAPGFTVYQVVTKGWLGLPPQWQNVVAFGADPSGTNDSTTAINNAITAAAAQTAGVVYLPAGTYKTTGGHVIPLNVSLFGDGKGITTFNHLGVGTYCFFIGSTTGGPNPPSYMGKVGGFTISGQSAGNGSGPFGQQIGIKVLNCLFFNLQDIHFLLLYEALLLDGGDENALGAGTFAGNGYVANCTCSNVYTGLHVYRWVTDTLYSFFYAFGNTPITSGSHGIWFDTKPATSTMLNVSCEGFDTGLTVDTTQQGLAFINPRLENCNTPVSWLNNTWGHIILGGGPIEQVWATGTHAGQVTQIAEDGWFPAVNSLPAASSSYQHAIYRVNASSGVADSINVCAANGGGTYQWVNLLSDTPDWINVVTAYGADPTGTNDSSTAIQNALNAVPAGGGVVYIPAGSYRVNTTLTIPVLETFIQGDGRGITILKSYVTGDCIRMYGTGNGISAPGGGITGLTIDGVHAGNNSSGVHAGDMFAPKFEFGVQNFTGTNSIGAWFDNNYSYMEQATGAVFATHCSSLVVFDNSVNTSGGATGSFDRTVMDFFIINSGQGNGVIFRNGAEIYDGRIGIYGNFAVNASAAPYSVLTITGSNAADGYSRIVSSVLNIGVELAGASSSVAAGSNGGEISQIATWGGTYGGNGVLDVSSTASWPASGTFTVAASGPTTATVTYTGKTSTSFTGCAYVSGSATGTVATGGVIALATGNTPNTINFGTQGNYNRGNQIQLCTGVIDFGANNTFAVAVNSYFGSFQFDGPVTGDIKLARSIGAGAEPFNQVTLATGGLINTYYATAVRVAPSGNVTGIRMMPYSSNDHGALVTVLNFGTGTITFDVSSVSKVADGTSDVINPNTAAMFYWDYPTDLWWRT